MATVVTAPKAMTVTRNVDPPDLGGLQRRPLLARLWNSYRAWRRCGLGVWAALRAAVKVALAPPKVHHGGSRPRTIRAEDGRKEKLAVTAAEIWPKGRSERYCGRAEAKL